MNGIRWTHRLRYGFDNAMSRGTPALIGILGIASLALIGIAALVMVILQIIPGGAQSPPDFVEGMWLSLMRTLDSGTMGGDEGRGFRIAMLVVTLGGIFIVSTLIGVLTSGIESQARRAAQGPLARRRAGPHADPRLVAQGLHDHLASWSSPTRTSTRPRIVILADKDKVEMEDEIRDAGGGHRQARGSSAAPAARSTLSDLEIVNPHQTRARSSSWRRTSDDPDSRGHQDHPGDHQQPGPAARAVPHRGRDPRPEEPGGGADGRRRRGAADRRPAT